MTSAPQDEVLTAWTRAMNLLPDALSAWLETPESASVGTPSGIRGRSVGQLSGEHTLDMWATAPEDWTADDWQQARRTLGYVRRHRAQFPRRDVTDTRWRYSLMNWGHDPLWLDRLVVPKEPGDLLVDGQAVGTVDWDEAGHALHLLDLTVEPSWRERGLATAVLHALHQRGLPRPTD